jgi:hypothetical protein
MPDSPFSRAVLAAGLALSSTLAAAAPIAAAAPPAIAGCPLLPADNAWNTDISATPVNRNSAAWMASMNSATTHLHPDFGTSADPSAPYGIPYAVVDSSHARVNVAFDYASESDPGPYPFGADIPIEGGSSSTGDRHALMVDHSSCTLYELYNARYSAGGSTAGSGAIFNLNSNALRPAGWTSADAAGLPILPGLLRPEEVAAGFVGHAIRFTAARTDRSYLWPARHQAGSASDPTLPPMGARFRLGASFDETPYSPQTRVVLEAMKHYGLMLADNGSNWFFQGAASNGWSDTLISELKRVPASSFEAIDESSLMVSPDSGQARQPGVGRRVLTPVAAVTGTDGALYVRTPGAGFTSLGGTLLGAPAVVTGPTSAAGSVYIGTGADHNLYVRGNSAGWQPLTSGRTVYCLDNPAATAAGGVLYVACQGGDHHLWHAEAPWPGSGLPSVPGSAWASLGGILTAGPAVAVTGSQPVYFGVGTDGHAWEWTGGGWSSTGWLCIGHPALAADASGNLSFACHGVDHQLYLATATRALFGQARPLGGKLVDGVGMAVTPYGTTLYAEGVDSQLWETSASGGGFSPDGGRLVYGAGGGAE